MCSSAGLRVLYLLGPLSLGRDDLNMEGDEELQNRFCLLQVQGVILSDLLRRPRLGLTLVAAQGLQGLADGQLSYRNVHEVRQAVNAPREVELQGSPLGSATRLDLLCCLYGGQAQISVR